MVVLGGGGSYERGTPVHGVCEGRCLPRGTFRNLGLGFRVQGSGFGVRGLGFGFRLLKNLLKDFGISIAHKLIQFVRSFFLKLLVNSTSFSSEKGRRESLRGWQALILLAQRWHFHPSDSSDAGQQAGQHAVGPGGQGACRVPLLQDGDGGSDTGLSRRARYLQRLLHNLGGDEKNCPICRRATDASRCNHLPAPDPYRRSTFYRTD